MPVWDDYTKSDKCSNCGANIFFDAKLQRLTCTSCGSVFNSMTKTIDYVLEVKDLNEASPDDRRVEYKCDSCGAVVITDETTSATICAFCGSPSLAKRRLRNEFKPDLIIPFKIDKSDAEARFKVWASEFKKAPKSFASAGNIQKIQGLYVPFWLIDATCHLDYNEQYQHKQEYDFDFKQVPFDGSNSIPDALMRAIEPYNYDDLVPYDDMYLHGYMAKRYDESAIEITDRIITRLNDYLYDVYDKSLESHVDEFRNENFSYVSDLKQQYALLPVWFLNYEYDGQKYQYAMNGQTGEVQGFDVPYSKFHYGKEYSKKTFKAIGAVAITLIILLTFAFISWKFLSASFKVFQYLDGSLVPYILLIIVGAIGYGIFSWVKKHILNRTKEEIKKPVYHIIDKAPNVEQYFDTSSMKKTINRSMR